MGVVYEEDYPEYEEGEGKGGGGTRALNKGEVSVYGEESPEYEERGKGSRT